MSLVDVSPSTEMQLKERSTARVKQLLQHFGRNFASVKRKPASCPYRARSSGTLRNAREGHVDIADLNFAESGFRKAIRGHDATAASCQAAFLNALRHRHFVGHKSDLLLLADDPRRSEKDFRLAASNQLCGGGGRVLDELASLTAGEDIELPELATIARTLPPGNWRLLHSTGMPGHRERVNVPAMVEPRANSATKRSCFPLSFRPAATPAIRTPAIAGIFGSSGKAF